MSEMPCTSSDFCFLSQSHLPQSECILFFISRPFVEPTLFIQRNNQKNKTIFLYKLLAIFVMRTKCMQHPLAGAQMVFANGNRFCSSFDALVLQVNRGNCASFWAFKKWTRDKLPLGGPTPATRNRQHPFTRTLFSFFFSLSLVSSMVLASMRRMCNLAHSTSPSRECSHQTHMSQDRAQMNYQRVFHSCLPQRPETNGEPMSKIKIFFLWISVGSDASIRSASSAQLTWWAWVRWNREPFRTDSANPSRSFLELICFGERGWGGCERARPIEIISPFWLWIFIALFSGRTRFHQLGTSSTITQFLHWISMLQ